MKALRQGSRTNPMRTRTPMTRNSRFGEAPDIVVINPNGSSLQAAAACHEDSRGTPLEEQDDGGQHRDLSHHGPQPGLEDLIGDTDAERGGDGAEDAADAAEHDDHEAVHDMILAQRGADIADLRQARARHAGEARAEREGHHVHMISADADTGGHRPILHDGADLQAERGAREEQVGSDYDEEGKGDYEN